MPEEPNNPTLSIVPDSSVRNGKHGGRRAGAGVKRGQNKLTQALKHTTVSYFCKILDDEMERRLWMAFITGQMQKKVGREWVTDEYGQPVMITLKEAGIELTNMSWAAFKRAVEYKRGLPIVTVESSNEKVEVIIKTTGADPRFFEQQAKMLNMPLKQKEGA